MSKFISKDLTESNYKNPRLDRQKKGRKKKLYVLIAALFVILVILSIYFIYISPYFRIQQVDITGLQNIKEDQFRQIIQKELDKGFIFKHDNILLFDSEKVRQDISDNYLLEWLNIEKEYRPAMIFIGLEEKVSALTYLTAENCYNIDLTGAIVEKCNHLSTDFIQIRDASEAQKNIGDSAINQATVRYIIQLNDELESQGVDIRTFKVISKDSSDLRVLTDQGFEIYFNRSLEIKEQLVRFNILVREEIGAENLDKINYIDLRFGDKVFYK